MQHTVLTIENADLVQVLQQLPNVKVLIARDNADIQVQAPSANADVMILDGASPSLVATVRHLRANFPLSLLAAINSTDTQLPEDLDDVLSAPFAKATLSTLLRRAAQTAKLRAEAAFHRSAAIRTSEEAIGRSDAMREALRAADEVARVNKPALIVGEPGTGKDLFARLVHRRSSRAAGPFISVDCASHPGSLLERELFGSAGSASSRSTGLIDLARGGTLALDRVTEMSLSVQQRMLAFLQDPAESGSVRILVMATPLFAQAAESGGFNRDLYALLSQQMLVLPPLRERHGDAALLSDFFLRQFAEMHGKPRLALDLGAREALGCHSWPGNVTELKNCIERAVLLANGNNISANLLALAASGSPPAQPLVSVQSVTRVSSSVAPVQNPNAIIFEVGSSLAAVEKELILRTVSMTRGNRTKAAHILGISIRTLYSKLLEYDYQANRKTPDDKQKSQSISA
jgi:two-component system, response regulator FlrC